MDFDHLRAARGGAAGDKGDEVGSGAAGVEDSACSAWLQSLYY